MFVCLNDRSCKPRGSGAVFKVLKEGAAKAGLRDVQITRVGCMGLCPLGPSVVIYPGGVSYHVPTVEDAMEILESHVIGGKVVERLLMERLQ